MLLFLQYIITVVSVNAHYNWSQFFFINRNLLTFYNFSFGVCFTSFYKPWGIISWIYFEAILKEKQKKSYVEQVLLGQFCINIQLKQALLLISKSLRYY